MREGDCARQISVLFIPLARNRLDRDTTLFFPFYEFRDFGGKKKSHVNRCRIELDGAPFALNVKTQHLEGSRFHSVSLQSIDYLLANFHT